MLTTEQNQIAKAQTYSFLFMSSKWKYILNSKIQKDAQRTVKIPVTSVHFTSKNYRISQLFSRYLESSEYILQPVLGVFKFHARRCWDRIRSQKTSINIWPFFSWGRFSKTYFLFSKSGFLRCFKLDICRKIKPIYVIFWDIGEFIRWITYTVNKAKFRQF